MNLDRGILIAVLILLVYLVARPQPGRYTPLTADQSTLMIDTATGKICGSGVCK